MVQLLSQENMNNIPSSKTIISAAATITATAVLLRTITNDLLPSSIHHYFRRLSNHFSSHLTVVIDDLSDDNLTANLMFDAANTFLSSKLSPSTKRIKITKPPKETSLTITIDKNQEIIDRYDGAHLTWISHSTRVEKSNPTPKNKNSGGTRNLVRSFELSFHKRHREMVLKSYLPYVLRKAKEIKEENKTLKLHTIDYNGTDYWGWTRLDHPATFESMAMEPEMKEELIEDLDLFLTRKEYYRRVGKAWKRGYLLYGPPGTGKSSLVAAMANYLKFDVYDLDLREVQCNSDLRRLLIGASNRSILVIEDIDCSAELQNRSLEKEASNVEDDKVTLSGLLNFIDGLWSSCSDERIIVFTTNHKDRLDPALLRPGRMDVHLMMSYCSFSGFKILAVNYLRIQEHPMFEEIEKLIAKAQVTPAEVAGELMKRKDAESALKGFVRFLQSKEDNIDMKTC